MTLAGIDSAHFLQYLFADTQIRLNKPLLCEKQGDIFRSLTWREVVSRISDFIRALSAAAIGPGDRVAFYATPGVSLLIGEWGVLASRGVAVIVPHRFSHDLLVTTLMESKTRLVVVSKLSTALYLANASDSLPDLRHIICLEGTADHPLPIGSWADFIESGRMEPDRASRLIRAITPKDTALLFYYQDEDNTLKATRYTHDLILQHVARIQSILAGAAVVNQEMVLTAIEWESPIGHIASCYMPPLQQAVTFIVQQGAADMAAFEHSPQVAIANAAFFDAIRFTVMKLVRQSADIESAMLTKAVSLGKTRYESDKKHSPLPQLMWAALQATIVKKVKKMLGGKLRLLIGVDNETHYETQLFFHTFGIELIELPQELFT